MRAIARGEEHAIRSLYCTHADGLFGFIYRRVGQSREDAEEIVQDTFLAALKLADTCHGESTVFSWLCGLAKLKIVDFYRRGSREKRIPAGLMTSLPELEKHLAKTDPYGAVDASILLERLMEGLIPDEQEALIMRYVDGLSLKEIASILGRTERAVDALLDRAKKKQRGQLKRWWEDA